MIRNGGYSFKNVHGFSQPYTISPSWSRRYISPRFGRAPHPMSPYQEDIKLREPWLIAFGQLWSYAYQRLFCAQHQRCVSFITALISCLKQYQHIVNVTHHSPKLSAGLLSWATTAASFPACWADESYKPLSPHKAPSQVHVKGNKSLIAPSQATGGAF